MKRDRYRATIFNWKYRAIIIFIIILIIITIIFIIIFVLLVMNRDEWECLSTIHTYIHEHLNKHWIISGSSMREELVKASKN